MRIVLVALLILLLAGCAGRAAAENAEAQKTEAQQAEAQDTDAAAESSAPSAPADGKMQQDIRRTGSFGVTTRVIFKTRERAALEPHDALICILAGPLPEEFARTDIGNIVAVKGAYGSVNVVLQAMADEGRRLGIDAIVEFQSGRQRSPLVWRMSTPTGRGRLVKLNAGSPPLDCEKAGGRPN